MRRTAAFFLIFCISFQVSAAQEILLAKPGDPYFKNYVLLKPEARKSLIKKGDRLAICGDSITEQRMYSRIIESYLTMCAPQLDVQVRQFGWSGEKASGFLQRMTNDCLRFNPSIATTCYGMNDHEYRAYEEPIGATYRSNSIAIIRSFKAHGVRVVHGSPGAVGKVPHWVTSAGVTADQLNLNLSILRNIGVQVAHDEDVAFADVFWPMLKAGFDGQKLYGTNYAIAGKDGVHPGWAGQAVMAYAFLKGLGVAGETGAFTVDLRRGKMQASPGHKVLHSTENQFRIQSTRYPFCVCRPVHNGGDYPICDSNQDPDGTIHSVVTLIPFNETLNRFMLRARNGTSARYIVRWDEYSKSFDREQLEAGINLAAEFPLNPFSENFAKVDSLIAAKQQFETHQIKGVFHGPEGSADLEAAVSKTEVERAVLESAIKSAFVPVVHALTIEVES